MPDAKLSVPAAADRAGFIITSLITSPRFAPALLITVLVSAFGALLFEAIRKPLWYDELLTFHVSGLQPFSLFWSALKAGVDASNTARHSCSIRMPGCGSFSAIFRSASLHETTFLMQRESILSALLRTGRFP